MVPTLISSTVLTESATSSPSHSWMQLFWACDGINRPNRIIKFFAQTYGNLWLLCSRAIVCKTLISNFVSALLGAKHYLPGLTSRFALSFSKGLGFYHISIVIYWFGSLWHSSVPDAPGNGVLQTCMVFSRLCAPLVYCKSFMRNMIKCWLNTRWTFSIGQLEFNTKFWLYSMEIPGCLIFPILFAEASTGMDLYFFSFILLPVHFMEILQSPYGEHFLDFALG